MLINSLSGDGRYFMNANTLNLRFVPELLALILLHFGMDSLTPFDLQRQRLPKR